MKLSFNTKHIQKKFAGLFDRDKEKFELTPYRDWTILMAVFLAAGLAAAGFGYYLFVQVNRGEFSVIQEPDRRALRAINVGNLEEVITEYEKKGARHEALLESRPQAASPD